MWQICAYLEYGLHMTPICVNQSDKFHMVAICQCYWGAVTVAVNLRKAPENVFVCLRVAALVTWAYELAPKGRLQTT